MHNYIIGVVREIRGTSIIIRLFDNSSQLTYFFNGEKYVGVMIGSYVGIKRGNHIIVVKIEKEYATDSFKDIENQSFSKSRFIREIETKVIGTFCEDKFTSGVSIFPQIFNDVILLKNTQIETIISGENKQANNNQLIKIGNIISHNIPFHLNWTTFFNTHIAIFGNTGSGKSNTLASIYNKLFNLHFKEKTINFGESKFLFIDFNGEYVSKEAITEDKQIIDLGNKDKLSIPYDSFWDTELLSIIFGATKQTQQPFLARTINHYFKNDFNLKESLKQSFESVYSSPSEEILNAFKNTLDSLDIKHDDFSEWIDASLYHSQQNKFYSKNRVEGWNAGKDGKYYCDVTHAMLQKEIHKIDTYLSHNNHLLDKYQNNPLKKLKLATSFQMIYDIANNFIQYDHIAPLMHRIDALTEQMDNIFDINREKKLFGDDTIIVVSLKNLDKEMKKLIPMIIAKISYNLHKETYANDKIFNLIIDEAHNILSNSSSVETEKWKDYRLDIFEEIIKEGRKFGYYLTIASQRPADISPTIVSQIHNFFIHRLVNDNDLKLLDKTMSSLDYVSKSSIPNLAPGEAIITGSSIQLPVIIKIDKLDDSSSPNSNSSDLINIWNLRKTDNSMNKEE